VELELRQLAQRFEKFLDERRRSSLFRGPGSKNNTVYLQDQDESKLEYKNDSKQENGKDDDKNYEAKDLDAQEDEDKNALRASAYSEGSKKFGISPRTT